MPAKVSKVVFERNMVWSMVRDIGITSIGGLTAWNCRALSYDPFFSRTVPSTNSIRSTFTLRPFVPSGMKNAVVSTSASLFFQATAPWPEELKLPEIV